MASVVARSRGGIHAAPVLVLSAVLAGLGAWLLSAGTVELAAPALLTSVLPLPLLLASGQRVVVSERGVWSGRRLRGRAIPWDRVSGLGATEEGGVTRFVVYVSDGPDVVFGGDWDGAEAVAASIQSRRPQPRGKADRQAALADPPRGDVRARLGAQPEVLDRLLDQVALVLAARGVRRMDRRRLQAFGDPQVYELFAICRRMLREPETHWEAHLRGHFRRVDGLRASAAELLSKPPAFAEVQGKLRLQLHRGARGRPIGAGFGLVLALRDAQGEISVPDALVAGWGVPRDRVVAQAEDNLLASKLQGQREPSLGISTWIGEYAAAQVAILDRRMDLDPDLGALVAVPGQEVLVAAPIPDRATLDHLLQGAFAAFVPQVFDHTASPLSPRVLWWCAGQLHPLDAARGSGLLAPTELHQRLTLREAGLGMRRA